MSAPILRHSRRPASEDYLVDAHKQLRHAMHSLLDLRNRDWRVNAKPVVERIDRAMAAVEAALEEMMPKTQLIAHSA